MMKKHARNGISYFTFDSFEQAGVRHAVFTRRGGVSPEPWDSLNFGALVGDATENVAENYRRAYAALDLNPDTKYDVWQVHSADVAFAETPRPNHVPHLKADIILTDRPDVSVFMRFADCVPILVYDPVRKVAGMIHAGWQGTVKQACRAAVEAMQARYACAPGDILAGIGPSISAPRYPVGQEVIDQFSRVFGDDQRAIVSSVDGRKHLDLQLANEIILRRSGVTQVEQAQICTATHVEDWFSHRAENGKTGRFGALICLV